MTARQRYETHRQDKPRGDAAVRAFLYHGQVLDEEALAHGSDHASAWLQLADKRRRHMTGGGGDNNGVKGRMFLPTVIAVTDPRLDVAISQPFQPLLCQLAERLDDFDGEHLGAKFGQYRRLVSRPCADLQNL